jgi:hypothetical protein
VVLARHTNATPDIPRQPGASQSEHWFLDKLPGPVRPATPGVERLPLEYIARGRKVGFTPGRGTSWCCTTNCLLQAQNARIGNAMICWKNAITASGSQVTSAFARPTAATLRPIGSLTHSEAAVRSCSVSGRAGSRHDLQENQRCKRCTVCYE